ncbi:cell surface receptor/MFS transporter [Cryomyces antarcticus]
MERLRSQEDKGKTGSAVRDIALAVPSNSTGASGEQENDGLHGPVASAPEYRVYKRRFFGLMQLVLLNTIISWDWLTFSAVSTTSSQHFGVRESSINWLSTAFLFAFVIISPAVIWTLNRGGPRAAIIAAGVLTFVGNWIRYAGTRPPGGRFGAVMFGQILIGLAQPFVLSAPTRYSDLWFSDKARVSATAVASLANPFGGALGQLIGPLWATKPSEVPNMVLYTAIISSIAAIPSFFVPAAPPSPPSASSTGLQPELALSKQIRALLRSASFYLVLVPFSVYVGFFNSTSSLLNQILEPYGFSEAEAGVKPKLVSIAGGLLILVGLVTSAVVSPFIDRTKHYLPAIKILVPLVAASYLLLVFAPPTRSLAAPYVACALLGATSFSLLPCALEYLVEITNRNAPPTHLGSRSPGNNRATPPPPPPVGPEVSSTVAWSGGQLLGAVFVLVMGALKDEAGAQGPGEPKGSMRRALVFQAVLAWAVVPLPLALGGWRWWSGWRRREGRGGDGGATLERDDAGDGGYGDGDGDGDRGSDRGS